MLVHWAATFLFSFPLLTHHKQEPLSYGNSEGTRHLIVQFNVEPSEPRCYDGQGLVVDGHQFIGPTPCEMFQSNVRRIFKLHIQIKESFNKPTDNKPTHLFIYLFMFSQRHLLESVSSWACEMTDMEQKKNCCIVDLWNKAFLFFLCSITKSTWIINDYNMENWHEKQK